ncbi:hypothetical protein LIER_25751 [Lithospermum erythrorhizon]|uniref:Uncharacterized protein n=1 Tax=Lithospermum erythrorhizon TaxID=34254 RepID=A0AAV3R5W9_LITER
MRHSEILIQGNGQDMTFGLEEIVEGYEALRNTDPRKWARYDFRPGRDCLELVNNLVERFNVFIIKARDQPIITMLNIIYYTIMT